MVFAPFRPKLFDADEQAERGIDPFFAGTRAALLTLRRRSLGGSQRRMIAVQNSPVVA